MSFKDYIAFPKEFIAFPMSDFESNKRKSGLFHDIYEKDGKLFDAYVYYPTGSQVDEDLGASFYDKGRAVFSDCFKNSFIYQFSLNTPPNYDERYLSTLMIKSDSKQWDAIRKLNSEVSKYTKQMLYESLNLILDVGEFAEIYTIFSDHVNYNYGPPISERTIDLNDVQTTYDLFETPMSRTPDIRHKLTIFRGQKGRQAV